MNYISLLLLTVLASSTPSIFAMEQNNCNAEEKEISNLYSSYCSSYYFDDESHHPISQKRFSTIVTNLRANNLSEITDLLSIDFLSRPTTSPEEFLSDINGVLNDTHSQRDISYLNPDNYEKIRKTICQCVIDPKNSEFLTACLQLNHDELQAADNNK